MIKLIKKVIVKDTGVVSNLSTFKTLVVLLIYFFRLTNIIVFGMVYRAERLVDIAHLAEYFMSKLNILYCL